VLRESMLSDQFDVDGLLDEDPSLSWSAPGVGPDVVKRLRKRHWPVQDELDLHGLTRDEARREVDAYLLRRRPSAACAACA
jgi:DNA-nicking Smr family endonuclease